MAKKKALDDRVIFAKLQDEGNLKWVYAKMLETNQTMRAIVEMAIEHARTSGMEIPIRETIADKAAEARSRRQERLKALAGKAGK